MSAVTESSAELVVTLALRLKGFAPPDVLVTATGLPRDVVTARLEQSRDEGNVDYRDGRIGGWHLTAAGRQHLVALLAAEREAVVDGSGLAAAYDGFLLVNGDFKTFCTAWQQDDDSSRDLGSYAAGLGAIHERLVMVLDDATRALVRFGLYGPRFDAARTRFAGGDADALARPLSASYHDVWMELHQDLLATLGRERSQEDGH